MAEDEIRKHTKAAYHTLMDREKSWRHKLKDVLVEIMIIVFAVTVSIWFHNWSDTLQEHKEERNFLSELKNDLKGDTANINSSLQFYEFCLDGMSYFEKVGASGKLNQDSLHKYGDVFFSNTKLEPHISRYEALKGSGKFNIIEDKQLLNNIIDLHESTLIHIETLDNYYTQFIDRVSSFIEERAQLDEHEHIVNAQALLGMAQMRLLLAYGKNFLSNDIIPAHRKGIRKCNELSQQIDKFVSE
jgi:hypothetical protein